MLQNVGLPAAKRRPSPAFSLTSNLKRQREELQHMLVTPGLGGVALARRHAEMADQFIRALWAEVVSDSADLPLLIGAVGGYGRQLLGLQSDLDLCFITQESPHAVASRVEAILYPLWDAGISVGHQVIRICDVVEDACGELKLATELLDFRPLSGDVTLLHRVQELLSSTVFSASKVTAFVNGLEEMMRARHAQRGDSVYLLEPDVKNGAGGLRDLDCALWASRARFGTGDLAELQTLGVLDPHLRDKTEQAVEFLWNVRNHLHYLASRKSDRLTFHNQEAVARALGYERDQDSALAPLQRDGAMVEAFMSDYYRNARVVAQMRDQLLGRAKRRHSHSPPHEEVLGGGLIACEGRVGLADPNQVLADPPLALRVYAAAVSRNMQVLSQTRDAIAAAVVDASFCSRLRDSREAADLFVKLVCTCRVVQFQSRSILAELHDVGLLAAMIPEFAPVIGRVHHDLYHVYTVDVHSVAAVDQLRAMTRGDLAAQLPLACRLAAEGTQSKILFLATLLHDVGKDIGGRDHARRGAELARSILARLGLMDDEVDDACHLVAHHLTMYLVAMRRDLADPATIAEFVREVGSRQALQRLYLLTMADLSTTSGTALTTWKASMLEELFRASDAVLAGSIDAAAKRLTRVRQEVRSLFVSDVATEALEQYLHSMPERYFLSNSANEIATHAALAIRPSDDAVVCSLAPSSHKGMMELCVVTEERAGAGLYVVAGDRPGLLAAISAAIAANRLTIQSAQVNSRPLPSGGYQAVDVFWIRCDQGDDAIAQRLDSLKLDITSVLEGRVTPVELLRPRSTPAWSKRPLPPVFTEVLFDHQGSASHTIIEVLTEDRLGLLYTLAGTLHDVGLSISVAKVSTEGTRVIDVFYVAEADGSKVMAGARTDQIRAALLERLKTAMDAAPSPVT